MNESFVRTQHLELVQGDDYLRSDGRGITFSGAGVCWPSNLCAARLLVTESQACGSAHGAASPVVMEFAGYFVGGACGPGAPAVCFDLPRHLTIQLAAGVRRYGFEVRAKSQVGHIVTLVRGSLTVLASGAISGCLERTECHPREDAGPGCRSCSGRPVSFKRMGDDIVLELADGTEWTVAAGISSGTGSGTDSSVMSADVTPNAAGGLTVTLHQSDGVADVPFDLPLPKSWAPEPDVPPNHLDDDGTVPTQFFGDSSVALGNPRGWMRVNLPGIGMVKVPYYTDLTGGGGS